MPNSTTEPTRLPITSLLALSHTPIADVASRTEDDVARTKSHVIVSSASAVHLDGKRIDGLAPMTSCTLWKPAPTCGPPRLLLTRGFERVTVTMMARGMVHAIKEIRENHRADEPLVSITETDEVWKIAKERVEQAEITGRMTADGLPTFAELHQLAMSAWIIGRVPQTPLEGHWLESCRRWARAIRTDALADYMLADRSAVVPSVTWSQWIPVPDGFLEGQSIKRHSKGPRRRP